MTVPMVFHPRRRLLPLVLAAGLLPTPALGAPVFRSSFVGSFVPLYGNQLSLADFDDDGHLDVAVLSGYPANQIIVFRGFGDGTFTALDTLTIAPSVASVGIQVADLNLDTRPDIVGEAYGAGLADPGAQ